jgi:hypothetical protein
MSTRKTIAFAVYLLGVIALIGFGVSYLLCQTIMPYHKEAIGMEWTDIPVALQFLLQALIKAAGGGFLVTGVAVLIIMVIPFRNGEKWPIWAIPLLVALWTVPTAYGGFQAAKGTEASIPWWGLAVVLALAVVGSLLSVGTQKE